MIGRSAGGFNIGGPKPDVETASLEYSRRFSGATGEFFLERQAALVFDSLPSTEGLSVLDVGGGHGQLAPGLVERGFDVTVTGSDPACAGRLGSLLDSGRLKFEVCDFLDLPFPPRSFDAVICFRLLPHVREWRRLIAELTRCARHRVVLDYPDLRSFNIVGGALFGLKKRMEGDTRPFLRFRRREVRDCLEAHGFSSIVFKPEFFFPMGLHRLFHAEGVSRALEATARGLGATKVFGSPVVVAAHRDGHA